MTSPGSPVDPLFLSFQLALRGRYSIDRELGRGGMGVVYLAREVHLDRSVAIKLLPPEKAREPVLRERFLREARLAAKLSHPNIIPIHSVDEVEGFVFYVMAFVDGETLAQRVRTRGPLTGGEGARVLREVAWALAHAHAQGLVHRDVKPDNILIETASGRVLVADFGIAAVAGEAVAGGVAGTPEFMSPEQALGKGVDARSDIYGLGVTAYYMFSGRLPFEGATATEVLAKQVTAKPRRLTSLGLSVPRRLALIVDACLAKNPSLRPASAEAVAERLGVALEQRRELPAALRAFVKRSGRIDGGGAMLYTLALGIGSVAVSGWFGRIPGFATLAIGATAMPLAYLVNAARRLSKLGFGQKDLGTAYKAEIDQVREEHAVEHGHGSTKLEEGFRRHVWYATVSCALTTLAALAGGLDGGPGGFKLDELVGVLLMITGLYGLISTTGYLVMLQRRTDVDTEFWSRVWMGRVGKGAFSIARKLFGKGARGSAMTHQATELSLSMAAEHLYESLPKETQRALGDLPALVGRLQDDAQRLRRRYDQLQELLAAAGDAGSTDEYAHLREERDAVHAKLGEAVGALETIRLNLLRLHAGSATIESLTTHVDLALEVSAEVGRLLAARAEVERELQFPRETAATPA